MRGGSPGLRLPWAAFLLALLRKGSAHLQPRRPLLAHAGRADESASRGAPRRFSLRSCLPSTLRKVRGDDPELAVKVGIEEREGGELTPSLPLHRDDPDDERDHDGHRDGL